MMTVQFNLCPFYVLLVRNNDNACQETQLILLVYETGLHDFKNNK